MPIKNSQSADVPHEVVQQNKVVPDAELLEIAKRAIINVGKGVDPLTLPMKKGVTADQINIARNSYIRLLGCGPDDTLDTELIDQDAAVVSALNNAKALDVAVLASEDSAKLGDYAARGFQASRYTPDNVVELLKDGGYGFVLEYINERGQATPYGFQFGFPFTPSGSKREARYRMWSAKTLPNIQFLTGHLDPDYLKKIWTLGRTNIISSIDEVRDDYQRLGVPIDPALEGQQLQRNRAGPATKLVIGVAAEDLEKDRIQCNIGKIIRRTRDGYKDLAENRLSFSSNDKIFRYQASRKESTKLYDDDLNLVAEIVWQILSNPPGVVRQNASESIVGYGWDEAYLTQRGHALARALHEDMWTNTL